MVTGRKRRKDFRVRQRYRPAVSIRSRANKANGLAGPHGDLLVAQGADANFRALEVHQNADRALHIPLERTNRGMDACMIRMGPVAEVKPECVHASKKQRFKHLWRSAGGAYGSDDFCPATTHKHVILS